MTWKCIRWDTWSHNVIFPLIFKNRKISIVKGLTLRKILNSGIIRNFEINRNMMFVRKLRDKWKIDDFLSWRKYINEMEKLKWPRWRIASMLTHNTDTGQLHINFLLWLHFRHAVPHKVSGDRIFIFFKQYPRNKTKNRYSNHLNLCCFYYIWLTVCSICFFFFRGSWCAIIFTYKFAGKTSNA